MANPKFVDLVSDSTTVTGTGTLTLTGTTATGCQTFATAETNGKLASGDTVEIKIYDSTNTNWEVVRGVYTNSGGTRTITRATVLDSSNGGAAVSFAAGTKSVIIVASADSLNTRGYSTTLVEVASGTYYKVLDDDVADTLISATSEPGSPQWTYTIQSGDIPTDPDDIVTDWAAVIQFLCKNNDASSRTLNYRLTLNGSNVGLAAGSVAISNTTPFLSEVYRLAGQALQVGDVIGIKFWGSVTNQIDYRRVITLICPRIIEPGTNTALVLPYESLTITPTGATGTSIETFNPAVVHSTSYFGDIFAYVAPNSIVVYGQKIAPLGNGNASISSYNTAVSNALHGSSTTASSTVNKFRIDSLTRFTKMTFGPATLPAGTLPIAQSDVTGLVAKLPTSTKGDLYGYNTAPARIPVGTNGQVLKSDSTNALGVAWKNPAYDTFAFRQVGAMTLSSNTDRWYAAGQVVTSAISTTSALSINALYGVPFVVPRDITIDRLGIEVTTLGASANIRLGIYSATSDTDLSPGSLVLDAGVVSGASTGIKTLTISQALTGGKLYYLAAICDVAVTVRTLAIASVFSLGIASTLGTSGGDTRIIRSVSYGALPSSFGTGTIGGAVPALYFRLA